MVSHRSTFVAVAALAVGLLTACSPPGRFAIASVNVGALAPIPTPSAPVAKPGVVPSNPPPWAAPAFAWDYILAAGLEPEDREMVDYHTHTHLTVYFNGDPVVVPGGIGIGPNAMYISWLHTHDNTGIVHVEAPAAKSLVLGQVFKEWGVSIDGAAGYDNGNPMPDAAQIPLFDGHEVVAVFGKPPATIPTKYAWK